MRKSFQLLFTMLLVFAWCNTFAQESMNSAGKIPAMRIDKTHTIVNLIDNPATIAYGYDGTNTLSMPMPAGTPFTTLGSWTAPVFASSMIKGGDGFYYLTDVGPPSSIWIFNPTGGTVTFKVNITGLGSGESANGIAYNSANGQYYLAAGSITPAVDKIYTVDINTGVATLVGNTGTGGLQIDLGITTAGVGYSYDLVTNNGYTINLSTGVATLLGPLGFDPNYGQGMSIDNESGTIFLSSFNLTTFTGQLRTMDPTTGNTTLVTDWGGSQIAPFALDTQYGPPCPIGAASNPSPANGATGLPLTGNTASWTNGSGTVSNEVWFGPAGNVVKVYDGTAITSFALPALNYGTTYYWHIVCKDGTCGTQGPGWSFSTVQDPNLFVATVDIYPDNVNYWTGTCDASTKTEVSLVNANGSGFAGWMVFNTSAIVNDPSTVIESVEFNGYLYGNNWPYWAITPMGSVNPVTATASAIYTQASTSYSQGTAYSYNQEAGTLTNGWIQKDLTDGGVYTALKNALAQGWFAIGIYDWDSGVTYFVNYQGWNEANKPYLTVTYHYIVPVELTSFTASANFGVVDLQWITATETNNQGFEVQRSNGGEFETIAFVDGFGTTSETQVYTYSDRSVEVGSYSYRLKQIDFDGTFDYSNVVEVDVPAPSVFALDQNYPNPFNPSTKINFQLKVDSKVSLKVFDILGQEVATLINTNLVAGGHSVNFDASALNSGVYLYRIEATGIDGSNFIDVKKMILTK
jgi:hypothetical protein